MSAARTHGRNDAAGAFGDVGVFVPLAVALVVSNGLSPTAVLGCAGAFYLLVAAVYRLPVPVQPMKVVTAVALADGLGVDVIAAAAFVLGAVLVVLGSSGLLDRVARLVPLWLVRGVQLAVGLALLRVAYGLLASPPAAFDSNTIPWWAYVVAVVTGSILLWRPTAVLAVLAAGTVVAIAAAGFPGLSGPAPVPLPAPSATDLREGFFVLVLAQLPLTITSSCVATADAMHAYYGSAARSVRVGRLARSIGVANLLAGASGGMMMCHGSAGVSAHYAFGARTWRAPALIGGLFVILAVGFGDTIVDVLVEFPLPMLAGMMLLPAVFHLRLGVALDGWSRAAGIAVGVGGFVVGIGQTVLVAGVIAIGVAAIRRMWPRPASGATVVEPSAGGADYPG